MKAQEIGDEKLDSFTEYWKENSSRWFTLGVPQIKRSSASKANIDPMIQLNVRTISSAT